jgi:hypothetical protein
LVWGCLEFVAKSFVDRAATSRVGKWEDSPPTIPPTIESLVRPERNIGTLDDGDRDVREGETYDADDGEGERERGESCETNGQERATYDADDWERDLRLMSKMERPATLAAERGDQWGREGGSSKLDDRVRETGDLDGTGWERTARDWNSRAIPIIPIAVTTKKKKKKLSQNSNVIISTTHIIINTLFAYSENRIKGFSAIVLPWGIRENGENWAFRARLIKEGNFHFFADPFSPHRM